MLTMRLNFIDNWEKFKVMIEYSSESEPEEEREENSWSEEAYEWLESKEDYGWSDYEEELEEEENIEPRGLGCPSSTSTHVSSSRR